jgi:hypothetical protein
MHTSHRVLEPAARQQYVPLLCNLEMESDNWRFRQLLALQLGELFNLYEEEVCVCHLRARALSLSLSLSVCACVRVCVRVRVRVCVCVCV